MSFHCIALQKKYASPAAENDFAGTAAFNPYRAAAASAEAAEPSIVDTVQANKIAEMVEKFIIRVERNPKRVASWFKIKPLMQPSPLVVRVPKRKTRRATPRPPAVFSAPVVDPVDAVLDARAT